MSAMWWFSKESARRVEPKVQRGLFIFAVSNSCVNPIVYGKIMFNIVCNLLNWYEHAHMNMYEYSSSSLFCCHVTAI